MKGPSRILFVLHRGARAGTELHVLWLAQALRRRGWEVALALSRQGPITSSFEEAGVAVHLIRRRIGPDPRFVLELVRLARTMRIDVLHAHSGRLGALAGRLARVPAVIETRHGLGQIGEPPPAWRLRKEAASCRLAHRTLTVSQSDRDRLIAGGLSPERVVCIPNGIPPLAIERRTQEGGVVRLGFLGRLVPQKDPLFLAAIARALQARIPGAWHLLIAGEGPLRGRLARTLERFGCAHAVEWLGEIDGPEALLSRVDLLCVPSRWEGQPLSILEAMAAGVVPLACSIASLEELLGGDPPAGLLLPRDAEAWASAAIDLGHDAERRVAIVREARRRIDTKHRIDAMEAAIEQVYRDCFASHSRSC